MLRKRYRVTAMAHPCCQRCRDLVAPAAFDAEFREDHEATHVLGTHAATVRWMSPANTLSP